MEPLVLTVNEIPEEGRLVTCKAQAEELNLTPDEARFARGLMIALELHRFGSTVQARGLLSGTVVRECVRCLSEYADEARLNVSVEFLPAPPARPNAAGPSPMDPESLLGPEQRRDADVYTYQSDRLDLRPMIREQVILATPMQPLCTTLCQGLCPVCGRNRNTSACGCVEEAPPTPFEALRKLSQRGDPRKGDPGHPSQS